jgi:hypothetical protein
MALRNFQVTQQAGERCWGALEISGVLLALRACCGGAARCQTVLRLPSITLRLSVWVSLLALCLCLCAQDLYVSNIAHRTGVIKDQLEAGMYMLKRVRHTETAGYSE